MNALTRWLLLCVLSTHIAVADNQPPTFDRQSDLGRALYFDTRLSKNRTQSCASCHDPQHATIDVRTNASNGAVSLGDNGHSLGDRNAPTVSYAALSPIFHKNKKGEYVGGQFLDGRENNLQGQAGGPPLNPIEMGMPNKQSVVSRIKQDIHYVAAFERFFGKQVFDATDAAYDAMTQSIATFEKTDFFAPFDSRYDRYLRGELELTDSEELGRTLFFSEQFTNCNLCHQLKTLPGSKFETFSNYKYHNIGVPKNTAVRRLNGISTDYVDRGLLENPKVDDPEQAGKFKVPTLRNIAVTGPYMHNGVFKDLRTVVLFYNKYNSKNVKRHINPETSANWQPPEVSKNISMTELQTGPALNNKRIDALVDFMKTLTDKRYEHLLEK